MISQQLITIDTQGRGSYEITSEIEDIVSQSRIHTGICNIFIKHTSASLMLCENADPAVRVDLDTFMAQLVPDGDSMFQHTAEGPDDMPAHVRAVLTQTNLSVPVSNRACALGIWQGIYLWEHRTSPHRRSIVITVSGDN